MLLVLTAYLISFAVFWMSGRVVALWLRHKIVIPEYLSPGVTLCASALFGFIAFWGYICRTPLGYIISAVIGGLAVCGAAVFLIRHKRLADAFKTLWPHEAICALLTGLLYLGLFGLHGNIRSFGLQAEIMFAETIRPNDNVLPAEFAAAITQNSPKLKDPNPAGWYSSDRPPLQTALVLAFHPLLGMMNWDEYYQGSGTALQAIFVVALVDLCRVLGFSFKKTRFVVLMCIFSGFAFYNSVYLWPKMIAGSFGIFAVLPFLAAYLDRRRVTIFEVAVGATAATLALLSHAGVVFSFVPLAAMVLFSSRYYYPWKSLLMGAIIAAAIYAPWWGYSSFVAPNKGRLLKLHLAGEPNLTDTPFTTLLVQSYSNLTPNDWLHARLMNLERLFGSVSVDRVTIEILQGLWNGADKIAHPGNPVSVGDSTVRLIVDTDHLHYDIRSLATMLRFNQMQFVFRALDFLNISWLLGVIGLIRYKRRWLIEHRGFVCLFLLNLATIVVWSFVEFGPGWTYITHASYTMMFIWFVLFVDLIYDSPSLLRITLASLHVSLFGFAWVVLMPGILMVQPLHRVPALQLVPLLVAVASISGIVLALNGPDSMLANKPIAASR